GIDDDSARPYDNEALLVELERLWKELGHAPRGLDISRHGKYSLHAYTNRWGSIRRLCERFVACKRGELPRAAILADAVRNERKQVSGRMRWKVMERDCFRCICCGRSPASEPGCKLHVDHINPVLQGG